MPGLENDEDETLDADETPTLEHQLPSQPCSMTHVQQVTQIPSVSSTYEGWVMLKISALIFYNMYIQNVSFVHWKDYCVWQRASADRKTVVTCVLSLTQYVVAAFPLQVHVQKVTSINGSHHLIR